MQWGTQASPSMNVIYPPLVSPAQYGHGGATYSFTADFRPPPGATSAVNTQNNVEPRLVGQQTPQWHYAAAAAAANATAAQKQGYNIHSTVSEISINDSESYIIKMHSFYRF